MGRAARWQADLPALLALLGLDLLVYGALLDPGRMLADYDAYVYFYPLRAYAAAAIAEGRLPLWNPASFLGVPFLANPQTAIFYPLSALFFWLAVPWAYGLNLVVHVGLAGAWFYAWARAGLRLRPAGAWLGGVAFMLGGVLSGQYGHLNQLSAAAWLPLVVLLTQLAVRHRSWRWAALAGLPVALQILAGHPQQTYMTLVAAGLVALFEARPVGWGGLVRAVGALALATAIGLLLAAVQVLPTAELAAASVRGGGLPLREAVAGSLWPWLVARALLPSYVNDLGSTEFLGYVGLVPLLLAVLALGAVERVRLAAPVALVGVGLFLALGGANPLYPWLLGVVPGLGSFRVPARWLLVYTVGLAALAGLGLDWLLGRTDWRLGSSWLRLLRAAAGCLLGWGALYLTGARATRELQAAWLAVGLLGVALLVACGIAPLRRLALPVLLVLASGDLWAAGADLASRSPVPIEAYAQPRDSTLFVQSRLRSGRVLSIASEEYELKETPDYREWYAGLPEPALTGLLVAAKRNEVLTPNLNLLYGLESVDGYDGGLLPTRQYLQLASLLVPAGRLRPDGVLISRLESLPDRRLMDLLNLRVVLASRAKDLEHEGVPYDRSILAVLGPNDRLVLDRVPNRSYTRLGLISAYEGAALPPEQVVGRVELTATDGLTESVSLRAGLETGAASTGDGALPPELERQRPWGWTAEDDPVEYRGQVPIPPLELGRLTLVNLGPERLTVRALTLIDERDGGATPLVLDDRLERTQFFDMKVYEYPDVLERAYLVHAAEELDDAAAAGRLAEAGFEPRSRAVVEAGARLGLTPNDGRGDRVEELERAPERVRLRTASRTDALLVLSEAYYPGWQATIDGRPSRLLRVDLALRGVELPPGEHEIELRYSPSSFWLGLAVSGATLPLLVVVLLWSVRGRGG